MLLRAVLSDDDEQRHTAIAALKAAELLAIGIHSSCELAWVPSRQYGVSSVEIAATIRRLVETQNVVVDRPAVAAGLGFLDAGGDFADGVIARDGRWLGGGTFVSFGQKAVKLVGERGCSARLLV